MAEEPILEGEVPERAMVVIPHPDDGEIGCGGTTARWVQQGCRVVYVLCTSGDKGSSDSDMTSEQLAAIREQEQLKAARVLGVSDVVFLGSPDGTLEDTFDLRERVVQEIRRHRPDVVFCTDPFRQSFYLHRDHRISGQVTLDAVFPFARDHLHYPEHLKGLGLSTHKVGAVCMWGTEAPNVYVDISDTIEQKVQALKQHISQVSGGERDVGKFVRERSQEAGGVVGVAHAEAFRRITYPR